MQGLIALASSNLAVSAITKMSALHGRHFCSRRRRSALRHSCARFERLFVIEDAYSRLRSKSTWLRGSRISQFKNKNTPPKRGITFEQTKLMSRTLKVHFEHFGNVVPSGIRIANSFKISRNPRNVVRLQDFFPLTVTCCIFQKFAYFWIYLCDKIWHCTSGTHECFFRM